ncbi:lipoyl(octanoyl) transferase LipB [Clostridium sp. LBM24168]
MRRCYVTEFKKLIDYSEGIEIQQKAFDFVSKNNIDGILLLLQHKPVITIGKSGGDKNILVSRDELNNYGIELCHTSRGGNITYHGPGQLVGYPILNLNGFHKDAHLYLRQLEKVLINTVRECGINAGIKPKYTGVWVGDRKIAAIGVGIRKWITKHGFALNISVNKEHFKLIVPCGIREFGICSMNDFMEGIDYDNVVEIIQENFKKVFQTELLQRKTVDDWWKESDFFGKETRMA